MVFYQLWEFLSFSWICDSWLGLIRVTIPVWRVFIKPLHFLRFRYHIIGYTREYPKVIGYENRRLDYGLYMRWGYTREYTNEIGLRSIYEVRIDEWDYPIGYESRWLDYDFIWGRAIQKNRRMRLDYGLYMRWE